MSKKWQRRMGTTAVIKHSILPGVIALVFLSTPAMGVTTYPVELQTAEDNLKCYVCHNRPEMREKLENGKLRSFFIDPSVFGESTHHEQPCTACHKDIKEIPHPEGDKTVNCTGCHYVGNIYGSPTKEADIERYADFQKSVHKEAMDKGNPDAPGCYDCHGTHDILPPSNPQSHINRFNVPRVCGRCHLDEYAIYKESVHGESLANGEIEAAICTDCHGEHDIKAVKQSDSSVYTTAISGMCSKCHGEKKLMSRFGIESTQVATYKESYHGKANQFGVDMVANCSSCHGYHDIRPQTDPKSSVNAKNLPNTCGKCHKGANINYTKGRMHVDAKDPESGIIFWVAFAFKILTMGTIAALGFHIFLDLLRRVVDWRKSGKS